MLKVLKIKSKAVLSYFEGVLLLCMLLLAFLFKKLLNEHRKAEPTNKDSWNFSWNITIICTGVEREAYSKFTCKSFF